MDEPNTPRYFDGILTKYGERYIFRFQGQLKEGVKEKTRGDDINFPSFIDDDGMRWGVRSSSVIAKVER